MTDHLHVGCLPLHTKERDSWGGVTGKWQKQSSLLKKETDFPSCYVTYIEKEINRKRALM